MCSSANTPVAASAAKRPVTSPIIPALLSKKANALMMRVSRKKNISSDGRGPVSGRMKFALQDARSLRWTCLPSATTSYDANGDANASDIVSLLYQPPAMAGAGYNADQYSAGVHKSAPGGMQGIIILEPILAKAAANFARPGGIRRVNAPEGKALWGPREDGQAGAFDQCVS